MDHRYRKVAEEQDAIGWRQFMEDMICHELRGLQEIYTTVEGSNITGEQWATGKLSNCSKPHTDNGCIVASRSTTGLAESKQHIERRSFKWLSKHSKTWAGRVYWKRINIWWR
jgi:hypothetical protein